MTAKDLCQQCERAMHELGYLPESKRPTVHQLERAKAKMYMALLAYCQEYGFSLEDKHYVSM